MEITHDVLQRMIELQGRYLPGQPEGERAYLTGTELYGMDLTGANLMGISMQAADLKHAILEGANLKNAYLKGVNLIRLEDAAVESALYNQKTH